MMREPLIYLTVPQLSQIIEQAKREALEQAAQKIDAGRPELGEHRGEYVLGTDYGHIRSAEIVRSLINKE